MIVPVGRVLAAVFTSVVRFTVAGEHTGAGVVVVNTRLGASATGAWIEAWQPPMEFVAINVCVPAPPDEDGLK